MPRKSSKSHLEDDHQCALMDWAKCLRLTDIPAALPGTRLDDYLFHIPNGGNRRKLEAVRFKRMGVKAGVSDLFLPLPLHGYAGLWIELKAPFNDSTDKNYPTKHQKAWLNSMSHAGYKTEVCYGWLEARNAIKIYLNGK